MKKILLIYIVLYAIGISACNNNRSDKHINTSIDSLYEKTKITNNSNIQRDTLWIDSLDWEIKEPFEEKGRKVLYRSCAHIGESNDEKYIEEVVSYYLFPRNSRLYDSVINGLHSEIRPHLEKFIDDTIQSIDLGDIPRNWYIIKRYRGNPYVFSETSCGIYVYEKAIMATFGDLWPYPIKSAEQLDNGSYRFIYIDDNTVDTALMEMKDSTLGIYYYDAMGMKGYYTNDTYLSNYDIIFVEGSTLVGINGIEFDK